MPRYLWVVLTGILVICVQTNALARGSSLAYEKPYETPAGKVRKSQWYLLSTYKSFRTYRMAKECRPIVNNPPLHGDCVCSFDTYGPVRPGYGGVADVGDVRHDFLSACHGRSSRCRATR